MSRWMLRNSSDRNSWKLDDSCTSGSKVEFPIPSLHCLQPEDIDGSRFRRGIVIQIPANACTSPGLTACADCQQFTVSAKGHGASEFVIRLGIRCFHVCSLIPYSGGACKKVHSA